MRHIEMPREIAEKWLKALRSGEYSQGRHRLCTYMLEDGVVKARYCCLGVLQMVVSGRVETSSEDLPDGLPSIEWCMDNKIVFRNSEEDIWNDPYLTMFGNSVSGCNDYGLSFTELADLIEFELLMT